MRKDDLYHDDLVYWKELIIFWFESFVAVGVAIWRQVDVS